MARLTKPTVDDITKGRVLPWEPLRHEPDAPIRILAVDPGTTHSGLVFATNYDIVYADGEAENDDVIDCVRSWDWDYLAIEEIVTSFGRPRAKGKGNAAVGIETFRCQLWAGILFAHGMQVAPTKGSVRLIPRTDMLRYYRRPGERSANDSSIRESMIARYPRTGGGNEPAVGTAKQPGPLYGVASHAWQALALAVYLLEHDHNRIQEPAT